VLVSARATLLDGRTVGGRAGGDDDARERATVRSGRTAGGAAGAAGGSIRSGGGRSRIGGGTVISTASSRSALVRRIGRIREIAEVDSQGLPIDG
jgi:hypothetical protein